MGSYLFHKSQSVNNLQSNSLPAIQILALYDLYKEWIAENGWMWHLYSKEYARHKKERCKRLKFQIQWWKREID